MQLFTGAKEIYSQGSRVDPTFYLVTVIGHYEKEIEKCDILNNFGLREFFFL